ncbi:hypothetical protein HYFRA_00005928 [Hymenoscyphus fraxineus]|uniref:Uncharacterized protein n=1 Tax=Hymenoscyphus fraxineus TaxID=746836 RepID=A0A9N9PU99_9HELO|nr:hypothetical protein HYFRA_00005928 [Hymenoscyphus fraxineus]
MKFSTISSLGAFLSAASAGTHLEQHVCTDAAPSTVYQTVTVTAAPGGDYYSGGKNQPVTTVPQPPYVTTGASQVTSVDYDGTKSTVWVYPTGSPASKDCTVAIYENNVVINVVVVNIGVTIINGSPITITKTLTEKPTETPTPPPTLPPVFPPIGGKVINVVVGADGQLKYKQDQVNAVIGDIIRFDFNSTNHTVTESTFDAPCTAKAGGFKSGFQFNNKNRTGVLPPVDFVVDRTSPIWFYCGQMKPVSHCGKGMVFAINPAGKFEEFVAKAKASEGGNGTTTPPATITSLPPKGTGVLPPPIAPSGTGVITYVKPTPTKVYYRRAALKKQSFNA